MVNKAKKQGTEWETTLRNRLQAELGDGWDVSRLADGGVNDEGDLKLQRLGSSFSFIIEAKAMAAMNIHDEVYKADLAAGGRPAAVIWKRLVRKAGNTRRTEVRTPVVAMTIEDFIILLSAVPNRYMHKKPRE